MMISLQAFRHQAEEAGKGYQTMINKALPEYLGNPKGPSMRML